MHVAIISDTYVPDREKTIPQPFRKRIAAADHIVHAGDFIDVESCEEVDLHFYDAVDVGDVTVAVTPCNLRVRSQEDRLQVVADTAVQYADGPRIGVGGRTSVVEDEEFELYEEADIDGPTVRVLDPGSATGADPAELATTTTAEVEDGELVWRSRCTSTRPDGNRPEQD